MRHTMATAVQNSANDRSKYPSRTIHPENVADTARRVLEIKALFATYLRIATKTCQGSDYWRRKRTKHCYAEAAAAT